MHVENSQFAFQSLTVFASYYGFARGCWHGKFIALHLQNVTDIYLKQAEQHMKEIYYLEAKNLLL